MAHSTPKPEIATPASPHKHRHRHSPETLSARATTTSTSMQHHRQATQSPASLMYLSIVVCVILNLTSSLGLQLVRAASGTNPALTNAQVSSQAVQQMAALQQQQQQSNSVIQYPATTASSTSTTTALKARYKTMYACEDRQLTMDCDVGSKINLIRANFGRFSITQCNDQGQLDLQTDCMSPITFRIMQERCQDKQRCSVNATSLIFGDKCPKTRKYLEVHFQCQSIEPDVVHLGQRPQSVVPSNPQVTPIVSEASGHLKPPNNPIVKPKIPFVPAEPSHIQPISYPGNELASSTPPNDAPQPQTQLPTPVINSRLMSYVNAINSLSSEQDNREPIMIAMRHLYFENLSRPRCYQWDSMLSQWTEQGTRIVETNQTHTICAFNQATTYVLVMDYSGPMQTISPPSPDDNRPIIPTGTSKNPIFTPFPDTQPSAENYPRGDQLSPFEPYQPIISPPVLPTQPQTLSTKLVSIFGYMSLAIVSLVMGLMALAFVASSMRSSAGAALKSLGNFAPFNGPKYNKRRQGHRGSASLHSNKDLLVINNSNGHQFIYAPASTKISNSSSTHILSAGQPTGPAGQHQGTLHRLQQQQMYSGNGATLSSLSGTGAQSNNYYYGLMGLNPLFQQQQSHHFSQHHLNQPQQQQHHPHQAQIAANNNHQANKSTISAESANSSSSSSGVESSSTSMQQQQQQAHTQQACLVSTSGNQNDFNLMGHHMSSNYGQHQQQNLFAHQQQAGALTLNAHYSTSGVMQSINMSPALHNRQPSIQLRDHIYECVDDDKTYMARLLMPANNEQQQHPQQFGTLGHQQFAGAQPNNSRAMTLSSRLLQDVFQQQQQQAQNCNSSGVARRNFPQTAIVRDHQGAKTNIICSKLAQVKPQRATEIGAKSSPQQQFAHTDVMAIYNKDDATTMTTAHQQQQPTSTNNSCYGQRLDTNVALNSQGKLSTDC